MSYDYLKDDPELWDAIAAEKQRQETTIELIASENIVSNAVRAAQGSVLTNKYAEGYPGHRYYGGCEDVDIVENLAINRAKELFGAEYVNVQPHSGSQANEAAYAAFLKPGDVILGMDLNAGGHLTHGAKVSFSGKIYKSYSYGLNHETELLDYDEISKIAHEVHPKMIVAGASAYSRIIDWNAFRKIADEVGAYLMVDIAHIAGLVATGLHPSPIPYADVVTSTTHKTLRGPRGGIILTNNEEIAKKINKIIFPGIQGGPLMHVIAAKAECFYEALQPEFRLYQEQVLKNIKALAKVLSDNGLRIISSGTDNHLILVDVTSLGINGKEAEKILDEINVTVNKNTIPFDQESPFKTSGIRLGSPAMTTRGLKEEDFEEIGYIIIDALHNKDKEQLKLRVKKITDKYPL